LAGTDIRDVINFLIGIKKQGRGKTQQGRAELRAKKTQYAEERKSKNFSW